MADTLQQSPLAFNEAASPVFSFCAHTVRVIVHDDDTWFVARDVMTALEYSGHSAPAKVCEHIPEEWKGVNPIHTPGGEQKMLCLSEPGLYFFLGRSDKPKALPFQKWVYGEVLPAIRKTGRYEKPGQPETSLPPIDVSDAPAMAAARKAALEYFASYRKAVSEGKGWVEMDTLPSEALQGLIADAIMRQRLLVSFSPDSGRMNCTVIAPNDFVCNYRSLARNIATGDAMLTNAELVDLAAACNQRLVQRLGNPAIVLAV